MNKKRKYLITVRQLNNLRKLRKKRENSQKIALRRNKKGSKANVMKGVQRRVKVGSVEVKTKEEWHVSGFWMLLGGVVWLCA